MSLTYTHRRSAWLGSDVWLPDSPLFNWNPIELFVVHWPGSDGAIDGDPGEASDRLDDYLRSIQRVYRDVRGYNIGYNVAGDYLGGTWELRGSQFKCAANAGLNDIAISYIVLTDLDGRITPQAIAAVQRMWAQVKAIKPSIKMIGHGQGPALYPHRNPTPTQCPGPLQTLITNGTFTQSPVPPPPPPPMPSPTGTYTVVSGDGWYAIARKTGMTVGALLELNNATLMTPLHPGMVLRIATPTTAPPDTTLWVTPPAWVRPGDTDATTATGDWPKGTVTYLQTIIGVPVTGVWDAASITKMKQLQTTGGLVADGVYGPQTVSLFLAWRGR